MGLHQKSQLTRLAMICIFGAALVGRFPDWAMAQTSPLLGGNFPISTASSHQVPGGVAFDGTNFLVVWHDTRTDGTTGDIYGARVTPDGGVLDPNGIPISTAPNWQANPAVAFDGSNYLVVWEDYRSGSGFADIYGARVSPNGQLLDPDGIAISTATGYQLEPAVAFDGVNYLVVWDDRRDDPTSPMVFGARVSPAGGILDPVGFPIGPPGGAPAVAFDGTNYLVVYNRNSDIHGARVSPSAVVLDTSGFPISTAPNNQVWPSVAFDGTNYLVAWYDTRNGTNITEVSVFGARVSPGGTLLDPDGIPISAPLTAFSAMRGPGLAFHGTNYLIAWADTRSGTETNIFGTLVTPSGMVTQSQGVQITKFPRGTLVRSAIIPVVAGSPTRFLVSWHDLRNDPGSFGGSTNPDVYGQLVSNTGGTPSFQLAAFPIPNRTHLTAKINSVFDHSMRKTYCPDNKVVGYTGEEGRSDFGSDLVGNITGCGNLFGFMNAAGTEFSLKGQYAGGNTPFNLLFLYYDGHTGYDYKTVDQCPDGTISRDCPTGVAGQIRVRAAAGGTVKALFPEWGRIEIDHGNGYETWYMHLSKFDVSVGQTVSAGQFIGISGDTAPPGITVGPHLHFEVRLTGIPVDPYGWEGPGDDPYNLNPA